MWISKGVVIGLMKSAQGYYVSPLPLFRQTIRRCYRGSPFIDLYQRTTGQPVSENVLLNLTKKHPNIDMLSHDRLQYTLQILAKFGITALDACQNVHLFTMNPITMDNYGEILKECGFIQIKPKYIIRYHTLVRSRTIARLKKEGLLRDDLNLEEVLLSHFQEWPTEQKCLDNFPDSSTSIMKVRMRVLEKYLSWKLSVTPDEFSKYCRNYLPLKHKPMSDIQGALDLAQNKIQFHEAVIRRNGFVLSADPVNTKLIIENVNTIAGYDIREAIRIEPAILKNNFKALLEIRDLLEEYRISQEAQRRYLRVYCMHPKTVKERLDELRDLKEYQVLKTNPRVLAMVVHKKKVMTRIDKILAAKKQCYSLNHLVSSRKVFNNYIGSFGNKVCGRDIAILISSSLRVNAQRRKSRDSELVKLVLKQLRRHKYWLHAALHVVHENIQFLNKRFDDEDIFDNCQLLLYPVVEIENYIDFLLTMRNGERNAHKIADIALDASYNNLNYSALSGAQILSLVLYEMEKKYHFSGDGIWAKQDGVKVNTQSS